MLSRSRLLSHSSLLRELWVRITSRMSNVHSTTVPTRIATVEFIA